MLCKLCIKLILYANFLIPSLNYITVRYPFSNAPQCTKHIHHYFTKSHVVHYQKNSGARRRDKKQMIKKCWATKNACQKIFFTQVIKNLRQLVFLVFFNISLSARSLSVRSWLFLLSYLTPSTDDTSSFDHQVLKRLVGFIFDLLSIATMPRHHDRE
jgi:hypothetical protein